MGEGLGSVGQVTVNTAIFSRLNRAKFQNSKLDLYTYIHESNFEKKQIR